MRFAREQVDHADDGEEGDHAGETQDAQDGDRIAADNWVVAAAVENDQVDGLLMWWAEASSRARRRSRAG